MLAPTRMDFGSLIYDTRTSFNPLSSQFMFDLDVSEVRDGYVVVSLAMPQGMTGAFAALLESAGALFKFMDMKVKTAAVVENVRKRMVDPVAKADADQARKEFTAEACSLFDSFVSQGHATSEAIRRTNLALKAKSHPWASYEIVRKLIGTTGRFRKKKGVR